MAIENTHSHVFNFNTDINKDKPHLMYDAKPFISCLLVNGRSIINKMNELGSYVYAPKLDLIIIPESWAREDISYAELSNDYFHALEHIGHVVRMSVFCLRRLTVRIPASSVCCVYEQETLSALIQSTQL